MTARRASRRLSGIAESATLKVDAKAKAMKADGRDVIGYGAGEPDFPTPAHIVDAAVEAARDARNHRYTPAGGLPELKAAICQTVAERTGRTITPANVLVTNGGKQAVFNACAALLDAGDEAVILAPYWTTYPECVALTGATPVAVATHPDQGWCPSIEDLEEVRTERTRLLMLCSPANPTGAVYPEQTLRDIATWALEHGIWIITDEIYDHLLYDGATAPSLPALVPEVANQCLVVNGVAKTYAMTGWRVGWVIGPDDVVKAATNLQSHSTSNVSNLAQRAAIAALTGPQGAAEEMRVVFDRRRRRMVELLGQIDGVSVEEPHGAFYCFPSFAGVLGREVAGQEVTSTAQLAEVLLEEAEVAIVPGEAFGAPGFARLSYALGDEALEEGLRRVQHLLGPA